MPIDHYLKYKTSKKQNGQHKTGMIKDHYAIVCVNSTNYFSKSPRKTCGRVAPSLQLALRLQQIQRERLERQRRRLGEHCLRVIAQRQDRI